MSETGFKHILTNLPVHQFSGTDKQERSKVLGRIAERYQNQTGIQVTTDYQFQLLHIEQILAWEEENEEQGENPIDHLFSLLSTGKIKKNIIVLQVKTQDDIQQIKDNSLRLLIQESCIFIRE
ncbi:hypothetical protein PP175_25870 (plasmid) [Aneurinibacillus sp. Ricciae_BoGa-3]|uniref:hypothetical protein n=1 Tax=Aneurinibacillus sp. Ricciae_BoGa-3 TaxID=3022697 RepID=UPI00233FC5DB|nr:hypothetical protein [Aneurinibacillus sp. Ricciae_BoGa-3]WCK57497.1 hypothetical protein PP175_25870 [Aneurinibacillus sp. Ricciae_BoGa-3]